jgi:hypothetical protein
MLERSLPGPAVHDVAVVVALMAARMRPRCMLDLVFDSLLIKTVVQTRLQLLTSLPANFKFLGRSKRDASLDSRPHARLIPFR